jgi:hypothetical protein
VLYVKGMLSKGCGRCLKAKWCEFGRLVLQFHLNEGHVSKPFHSYTRKNDSFIKLVENIWAEDPVILSPFYLRFLNDVSIFLLEVVK